LLEFASHAQENINKEEEEKEPRTKTQELNVVQQDCLRPLGATMMFLLH
jgi:hypothetical protein